MSVVYPNNMVAPDQSQATFPFRGTFVLLTPLEQFDLPLIQIVFPLVNHSLPIVSLKI